MIDSRQWERGTHETAASISRRTHPDRARGGARARRPARRGARAARRPRREQPTPTPDADRRREAPTERVFAMPADCTGPAAGRRASRQFTDQGLVLLGGPGGSTPHYYADPTPEEQAGGISCIWGDEAVPESTVTVSVAPLNASHPRRRVVDNLIAQGLNEAVLDDGISYAQLGDENSAPAVLNIVRDDSWISVIEALGGEALLRRGGRAGRRGGRRRSTARDRRPAPRRAPARGRRRRPRARSSSSNPMSPAPT